MTVPMRPRDRPRVFLCDAGDALRASVRELLTDLGVEVVGEAADALEALRAIPPLTRRAPVVALIDPRLPGPVSGIEATRLLVDRCDVRVLIFSVFPGWGIQQGARRAGAVGVLAKGAPAETIVGAIERAWAAGALAAVGG